MASTGVMPSAYPMSKSIPSDTTPRILFGGRFTTKSACFPSNVCRIHTAIRVTSAMEAGITHHLWDLKELIA